MEPQILDKKLLYAGYIYYFVREANSRSYWTCNRKRECDAKAITYETIDEQIVIAKGPLPTDTKTSLHGHPPSPEEVEAEKFKWNLKRLADENPEVAPAQILRNELPDLDPSTTPLMSIIILKKFMVKKCQKFNLGVVARLPSRENLKKSMRRKRRADFPTNPKSLAELGEIPDQFQVTLAGERFLVSDDNRDGDRVITFATRRNLEVLARSEIWFVDGTFKVD